MYLNLLRLTNFRQFQDNSFRFKPGFNLLVGENGAGKTTVLRGVCAALWKSLYSGKGLKIEDGDISLHEDLLSIEATVYRNEKPPLNFNFRKSLGDPWGKRDGDRNRPKVIFYPSNVAVSPEMRERAIFQGRGDDRYSSRSTEEYLYATEREYAENTRKSRESRFGDSRSVREFVSAVLETFASDMGDFYWRFIPYDCQLKVTSEISERDSRNIQALKDRVQSFAMRWFEESSSIKPIVWPDTSKVLLRPGGNNEGEHEEFAVLGSLWGEMIHRINFSEQDKELLWQCNLEVRLTPRIMLQRKQGVMSLEQLSDGEKRLFMLFVDIARQLQVQDKDIHSDFGTGEAIILIDEIDVHLHPRWQRLIVPALEDLFPNCQFIATTHSPFVIQAADRDKVIVIDSDKSVTPLDGGNSIEDIIENIQGIALPQRSHRAEKLSRASKRYFYLLELKARGEVRVNPSDLKDAEKSYREASEPFTSDSAVHALLEMIAYERAREK